MDRETQNLLMSQLARHEGYRQFPYQDTVGKLTIGYGRNLTDVGISRPEASWLMKRDIDNAVVTLIDHYPWFQRLDPVRQAVLVNMCFNLGATKLSGFVNTLAMIERGDYVGAALGMLTSKWAHQVKSRAVELSRMMQTGKWEEERKA